LPTYYWNYNRNIYWDGPWTVPHRHIYHKLYYCSSLDDVLHTYDDTVPNQHAVYDRNNDNPDNYWWNNCIVKWSDEIWVATYQSYGQYKNMFIDVKDDVDYITGAVKDDDDQDLWRWPIAIYQSGNNLPQELYLISNDKTRRLFFRRKMIESADYNGDGSVTDSEKLYSIQVLQLRWLDAWEAHDFDAQTHSWVYDGMIDTWVCDYSLGFVWSWQNVWWAYSWFRLPIDENDCWQDLLTNDITISDWNLSISPLVDPYLAWADDSAQINPFITINFTAKLYGKNWNLKIPRNQMNQYNLKLQTTFSFFPINNPK
jgi:hypothetical protein